MNLARTMAISALICWQDFYLLSLSQLTPDLMAKIKGTAAEVDIPAIAFGIIGAIILQMVFCYVSIINTIFATAPLDFHHWLFCLAVGLPMIL